MNNKVICTKCKRVIEPTYICKYCNEDKKLLILRIKVEELESANKVLTTELLNYIYETYKGNHPDTVKRRNREIAFVKAVTIKHEN